MDETQDYAGLIERFETDENLARMVEERINSPRGGAVQRSYVSNRNGLSRNHKSTYFYKYL
jgi:hypothetical protein